MSLNKKPKIVVIGGGTGLPVLLRGLKRYDVDLTAIVTVADDGGSSGRIRDDLNIPAPGDIRNVLAALSDVEPLIEDLFQHRFDNESQGLSGHALGNLLLAAMTSITGDFVHAIREMSKVLNVRGKVLPSANQSIILKAEMEDGTIISGESKIPLQNKTIKRVFLYPKDVKPLPEAIHQINRADMVIIGPGSLYTSILPNLLVPNMAEALYHSPAKKVYVCNIMTQLGETFKFTASDHVKALYDHIQYPFLNTIVVNDAKIPEEILERYKSEHASIVENDIKQLEALGLEVFSAPMVEYDQSYVRHDTKKLAEILLSFV